MRETGAETPTETKGPELKGSQGSERSYADRMAESQDASSERAPEAGGSAASDGRVETGSPPEAEQPTEPEDSSAAERPTEAELPADERPADSASERSPQADGAAEDGSERPDETDRPVDAGLPTERRRSYADRMAESRRAAESDRAAKSEGPGWPGDEGELPLGRPEETERPAESERPVDLPEGGEPLSEYPEIERQLRDNLERARQGVERWGPEDRHNAERWFGSSGPEVREHLDRVLGRIEADVDRVRLMPFGDDLHPDDRAETFAYVHSGDTERRIYVGELFGDAGDVPPDSQAGILVHEMSHFKDIAATGDVKGAYGVVGSQKLAIINPPAALNTADNLEYFVEEYSVRGGPR